MSTSAVLSSTATPRIGTFTPMSSANVLESQVLNIEQRIDMQSKTQESLLNQVSSVPNSESNTSTSSTNIALQQQTTQKSILSIDGTLEQLRLNHPSIASAIQAQQSTDLIALRVLKCVSLLQQCKETHKQVSINSICRTPEQAHSRTTASLQNTPSRGLQTSAGEAPRTELPTPLSSAAPTPLSINYPTPIHGGLADETQFSSLASTKNQDYANLHRDKAATSEYGASMMRTRRMMSEGIENAELAGHGLAASTEALRHASAEATNAETHLKASKGMVFQLERKAWIQKNSVRVSFALFLIVSAGIFLYRATWFLSPAVYAYKSVRGVIGYIPGVRAYKGENNYQVDADLVFDDADVIPHGINVVDKKIDGENVAPVVAHAHNVVKENISSNRIENVATNDGNSISRTTTSATPMKHNSMNRNLGEEYNNNSISSSKNVDQLTQAQEHNNNNNNEHNYNNDASLNNNQQNLNNNNDHNHNHNQNNNGHNNQYIQHPSNPHPHNIPSRQQQEFLYQQQLQRNAAVRAQRQAMARQQQQHQQYLQQQQHQQQRQAYVRSNHHYIHHDRYYHHGGHDE